MMRMAFAAVVIGTLVLGAASPVRAWPGAGDRWLDCRYTFTTDYNGDKPATTAAESRIFVYDRDHKELRLFAGEIVANDAPAEHMGVIQTYRSDINGNDLKLVMTTQAPTGERTSVTWAIDRVTLAISYRGGDEAASWRSYGGGVCTFTKPKRVNRPVL